MGNLYQHAESKKQAEAQIRNTKTQRTGIQSTSAQKCNQTNKTSQSESTHRVYIGKH